MPKSKKIKTSDGFMKIAGFVNPERQRRANEEKDIELGKHFRATQKFKRLPVSQLIRPEDKKHRKSLRRQEELFGITTLV